MQLEIADDHDENLADMAEKLFGTRPTVAREHHIKPGIQFVYNYENGYGASVVRFPGSYGHEKKLWELAVLEYNPKKDCWDLTYDTPITDDVEGYLTERDITKALKRIENMMIEVL